MVSTFKYFSFFWIIAFSLIYFLPAYSQENLKTRLFLDVPADTFRTQIDSTTDSLRLPAHFLIPHSERIYRNSFKLLPGIHYRIEPRTGKINFSQPLQKTDSLEVIYQKYPLPFIPEYYHRQIEQVELADSSGGHGQRVKGLVGSSFLNEFDSFSSNLQRSGSIVRGIEIGNNRDLTLNSGLNLQLSGYITDNVQLVAALTDESTPIQPEGNTQTLREVDKVFVKIQSPRLGGTLGDFNLQYRNSYFGDFSRKLQGITASGQVAGSSNQVTYATSRGTFTTNKFLGQEGNQGPYQLVGKNGAREIIVLAGTEKVYVNGVLQTRGENNDYIIDYSLGQITFANGRLITSEDRIEVDFEYADTFQRYGKTFIGFSSANNPETRGIKYDFRVFREWDDTRNLLEDSAPLTDEEKAALQIAGDDPLKAGVTGASFVGDNNGTYVKKDTTISGVLYSFFKYVGSAKGDHTVRFTGVGRGNGDYVKESLGVYRFVGPGAGDYRAIRLVPLAGDKKLADFTVGYKLGGHFNISSESAVSIHDQNVFSTLGDGNNTGQAFRLGADYQNRKTRILGKTVGSLQWQLRGQYRQARFSPLDRDYQPEYDYKWNLNSNQITGDEKTVESILQFSPHRRIVWSFDGGYIDRGSNITAKRVRGDLTLPDSSFLKGAGFWEVVGSQDSLQSSRWQRGGASLGRQFGHAYPFADYHWEDRKTSPELANPTGFRFAEKTAGLNLKSVFGMDWSFKSRFRDDYLYNPRQANQVMKLAVSQTHNLDFRIQRSQNWEGLLSLVYRQKNFEPFFQKLPAESIQVYQPDPQFQDTTWNDRQSHLANMEIRYRNDSRTVDSRWNYKIASELLALQEKVFLDVGENRGNYRFDDILQEYVPDPQGNYLLVVVPTGSYNSVTNVTAGWQIRYRPRLSKEKKTGFRKLLRNVSTYTYLMVDEKSRENNIWQLYLLNFSKFHNINSTLQGTYQVNQDVYLFENNPDYGFQLRSRYRDDLSNQYLQPDYNEKRTYWERSIHWRQRIWKTKLSQESEYKQVLTKRAVGSVPSRNRDVFSQALLVNLNYRPVYAWQAQMGVERGWEKDRDPGNLLGVRYWDIRPQINYAVRSKARAIATMSFLRVSITDNPLEKPIPYEMGKGKKEGNSLQWSLRFEYFISNNITVTANYNGRNDAGSARPIHLAQVEVRAFF